MPPLLTPLAARNHTSSPAHARAPSHTPLPIRDAVKKAKTPSEYGVPLPTVRTTLGRREPARHLQTPASAVHRAGHAPTPVDFCESRPLPHTAPCHGCCIFGQRHPGLPSERGV